MKRFNLAYIFLLLLILITSSSAPVQDSFWVWKESDLGFVGSAFELYLYQGDFKKNKFNESMELIKRGVNPNTKFSKNKIIPVIRVYELRDPKSLAEEIEYLINIWESKNVKIDELQIDFDSPSKKIAVYTDFLKNLKSELKNKKMRISITGMLAWLTEAPDKLEKLAVEIDYICFQLYSDYQPVNSLNLYLNNLKNYNHPFKLGVTLSPLFEHVSIPPFRKNVGNIIFLNR